MYQRYHKIKIIWIKVFCRHRKEATKIFLMHLSLIYLFVCVLICQALRYFLYASTLLEPGNTEMNEIQSLSIEGPHSRRVG